MTDPYSPPLDDVTTALLGLLRTGGRTVYDAVYDGDPLGPAYPYDVLYPIPGGDADPMPDLDLDLRTVTAAYQLTTVSNLRNQCQRSARVARDLLTARDGDGWLHDLVLPAGWACIGRHPDPVPAGVDRVGEVPNAVFTCPARYLLTIAPTT